MANYKFEVDAKSKVQLYPENLMLHWCSGSLCPFGVLTPYSMLIVLCNWTACVHVCLPNIHSSQNIFTDCFPYKFPFLCVECCLCSMNVFCLLWGPILLACTCCNIGQLTIWLNNTLTLIKLHRLLAAYCTVLTMSNTILRMVVPHWCWQLHMDTFP